MKLSLSLYLLPLSAAYRSEFVELPGHTVKEDHWRPLPADYLEGEDMPGAFTWGDVDG